MSTATSSDHQIELSNGVLLLRPFRLDDAELLCAAVHESLADLIVWLSWCHEQYDIKDSRTFLEARAESYNNGEGEYAFAIIERATGRFLGACGINQIDRVARRANLGYWLRTSATGHG